MTLTGANTYTGATVVNGNQGITLAVGRIQCLAGLPVDHIKRPGSFTVDNTTANGGNNNNRINDSAAFTLNGGTSPLQGATMPLPRTRRKPSGP